MAVTMNEVRQWLDPEEPDYAGARAALGSDALVHLATLAAGGDLALASKSIYLASTISSPESVALLRAAYARREPVLSVATAAGIRNLNPEHGAEVFEFLHADPDPGVRKVAVNSAALLSSPEILARLNSIAESDPEPSLRELAIKALATQRR
jgi:hypothetical protein